MGLIKKNEIEDLIIKILKKYYPIKKKYDKTRLFDFVSNLSHFSIDSYNSKRYLPFYIDIKGDILMKGDRERIVNVETHDGGKKKWDEYLKTFTMFLRKDVSYCINRDDFMRYLHYYNYIDMLNIKSVDIYDKNGRFVTSESVRYVEEPYYKNEIENKSKKIIKIKEPNHFYFDSFSIMKNKVQLKKEMTRLFRNRDKYGTLHFHLDKNHGGDLIPVHLILRCLVGKRENWMRESIKKDGNKIIKWDPWEEEDQKSPSYQRLKELDLEIMPEYSKKYDGKIYLYMNEKNGSASWYFITYLVYAFTYHIKRYRKKCNGRWLKFGKILKGDQLVVKGLSSTCSGDGNSIEIDHGEIEIECPTIQFVKCSVKNRDWNRFWTE